MHSPRFHWSLARWLAPAAFVVALPGPASAAHPKAVVNGRLKGSYGLAAQGYFGADYDPATGLTTGAVAMRVGVFRFDGKGHCFIHSLVNKAWPRRWPRTPPSAALRSMPTAPGTSTRC
ncbi:hypothetical protein [Candidatus Methylocalor cossyra]|uniref:Uncharacterized protein n=1 Tax=Candidatus Methylocalor cossyra TaxID=3108543 RepID=A0ABM9NI92_9GAMM